MKYLITLSLFLAFLTCSVGQAQAKGNKIPSISVKIIMNGEQVDFSQDNCFRGNKAKVVIYNSTTQEQVVYLNNGKVLSIAPDKSESATLYADTLSDGTDRGISLFLKGSPAGITLYNDCKSCDHLSCNR